MSEEEQEAIEYLSNLDTAFIVNGLKKKTKQAIQTALDYIDKLQKENEQYKDTVDKLENQIVLLSQILES